jgi:uncharacterized protein GlcG (DUF336 family)
LNNQCLCQKDERISKTIYGEERRAEMENKNKNKNKNRKVLGDQLVMGKSISYDDAREVLEAMLKYCTEAKPGRGMALAVVDAAGIPVTIARMDGASPNNLQSAINKAYTAIDWRRDTRTIGEFFSNPDFFDPNWPEFQKHPDINWHGNLRHCPIPGGVLLTDAGTIVGAVGTSGRLAHIPGGDEDIAQVGARAYQDILRREEDI